MKSNENDVQELSISQGLLVFEIEIDGHVIVVKGSAWSGKEEVFVDGVIVSSKRSWRRQSVHMFHVDNVPFEIEVKVLNIIAYEIQCSIIKKGVHFKTIKRRYLHKSTLKRDLKLIALVFVIFFFGEYVGSYLNEIFTG